jgi:hypothetical protein
MGTILGSGLAIFKDDSEKPQPVVRATSRPENLKGLARGIRRDE